MLSCQTSLAQEAIPGISAPLSGWGRYPVVTSHLLRPEKVSTLIGIIEAARDLKVLARGAGRSYGDASLNDLGYTVLMQRLDRMLSFDPQEGILTCESGVTLKEILDVFVPRGWFPYVTPGTKFVTVGGVIACDVHGKNHHRDGSFSSCLESMRVAGAAGEIVECSRQVNSDLFRATVGGMGLTGAIVDATFSLRRITSAYIKLHSIKSSDLDETMALFDEHEPNYQYSVAWIDCLASGRQLGRSILMLGNHADPKDLDESRRAAPLVLKPKRPLEVAFDAPTWLLNRYTMSGFNALYYFRQIPRHLHAIVDYDSFFYPLDRIFKWNRLYGKSGFVQYQCVFPAAESGRALAEILALCAGKGWGSFLAVLKRFGPQQGLLCFPMPGYTLTLDMPVRRGLWEFLGELDRLVLNYGGRVYLAKDARLSAETFRQMYPEFENWLAVKSAVDPENLFSSALSRRLEIC